MGNKRKASDSVSPCSSSPSITSPSHSTANRPQPFPSQDHPPSDHTSLLGWNTPDAYFFPSIPNSCTPNSSTTVNNTPNPHLNSRTRKRFRDNRPDEEKIHQATLSKLYTAQQEQHLQRRHEQNPETSSNQDHNIPLIPSPTPSHAASTESMTSTATDTRTHHREKAQTSLHAFFSGGGSSSSSGSGQTRRTNTPVPNPNTTVTSPTVATIPRCEDCCCPLFPAIITSDTEMMDIDYSSSSASSSSFAHTIAIPVEEEGRAYACANCGRCVCDVCAVSRERRLCLECAKLGNGNGQVQAPGFGYEYDGVGSGSCGMEVGAGAGAGPGARMYGVGGGPAVSVGEKRWIGGIGWM